MERDDRQGEVRDEVDVETKAVTAGAGSSRREMATAQGQGPIHLWTLSPRRLLRLSSSPLLAASASADSSVSLPTPTQATRYPPSSATPNPLSAPTIMSELLSLSVLQLLSVFSFLTSVLAVVCVGSGSLHRLAHRLEPAVDAPAPASDMDLDSIRLTSGKHPLWNWSGLPVSFSLDTLIGEEEKEQPSGYVGGTELTRMDWQVSSARSRIVASPYDSRVPMSMAKLIMTRHTQRRPAKSRRIPGMPRQATPRSRLAESVV